MPCTTRSMSKKNRAVFDPISTAKRPSLADKLRAISGGRRNFGAHSFLEPERIARVPTWTLRDYNDPDEDVPLQRQATPTREVEEAEQQQQQQKDPRGHELNSLTLSLHNKQNLEPMQSSEDGHYPGSTDISSIQPSIHPTEVVDEAYKRRPMTRRSIAKATKGRPKAAANKKRTSKPRSQRFTHRKSHTTPEQSAERKARDAARAVAMYKAWKPYRLAMQRLSIRQWLDRERIDDLKAQREPRRGRPMASFLKAASPTLPRHNRRVVGNAEDLESEDESQYAGEQQPSGFVREWISPMEVVVDEGGENDDDGYEGDLDDDMDMTEEETEEEEEEEDNVDLEINLEPIEMAFDTIEWAHRPYPPPEHEEIVFAHRPYPPPECDE